MSLYEYYLRIKIRFELFMAHYKLVWAIKFGDPDLYFQEYEDKIKEWEELTKDTIK